LSQPPPIVKKIIGTAGTAVASRGLALIAAIILARYLGPDQYGLYSFTIAIIVMVTIPVIAGLPRLLVREIAHADLEKKWDELKGLVRWATGFIVILSLVTMTLLSIALYRGWIDAELGGLLWFALLLIPIKSLSAKQGAVLNGFRQPVLAQMPTGILAPLIALASYSLFIVTEVEFTSALIVKVQVVTSLAALFVSVVLIHNVMPKEVIDVKPSYLLAKWHSALLPFTMMAVIVSMNADLASVLLGIMAKHESVAHFKVAMQGVGLIMLALTAVNAVTGPNIARLYKKGDMQAVQLLITRSVRLSCACSAPIVVFLVFYGDWIVTLLFGVEYLPAARVIGILCVGQIVNVAVGSVDLILTMTGNEKRSLRALFITTVLNIVLLVTLIPLYQEVGAAIAVTIGLVFMNVLMAIDVRRITGLKPWLSFSKIL
jgi:O-antigen/teichoic acid export membrane protein